MGNDLDKILKCSHHDPFHYLGAHFSDPKENLVTLRTFQPHALNVNLLLQKKTYSMECIHPDGVFEITLDIDTLTDPSLSPYTYQYEIYFQDGTVWKTNDPYRFTVQLGEQDQFLFNGGKNYRLYNHLGAHAVNIDYISGIIFRVWVPNASSISIVGNFNSWDGRAHQMRCLGESGIWELFIPHLQENEIYKFSIKNNNGHRIEKCDPFQFYGELRPRTGSVVKSLNAFNWNDHQWQKRIAKQRWTLFD